jgi:hypothetical protein
METFGGLVGAKDTTRVALLRCRVSNLWAAQVSPFQQNEARNASEGMCNLFVDLRKRCT